MAARRLLERHRSLYKGVLASRSLWELETRRSAGWISSVLRGEG